MVASHVNKSGHQWWDVKKTTTKTQTSASSGRAFSGIMNCIGGGFGPSKKHFQTGSNNYWDQVKKIGREMIKWRNREGKHRGEKERDLHWQSNALNRKVLLDHTPSPTHHPQVDKQCEERANIAIHGWDPQGDSIVDTPPFQSKKLGSLSHQRPGWLAISDSKAAKCLLLRVIWPSWTSISTPSMPVSATSPTSALYEVCNFNWGRSGRESISRSAPAAVSSSVAAVPTAVLVEPTAHRPIDLFPWILLHLFWLSKISALVFKLPVNEELTWRANL